jgi:hypothetical protein
VGVHRPTATANAIPPHLAAEARERGIGAQEMAYIDQLRAANPTLKTQTRTTTPPSAASYFAKE